MNSENLGIQISRNADHIEKVQEDLSDMAGELDLCPEARDLENVRLSLKLARISLSYLVTEGLPRAWRLYHSGPGTTAREILAWKVLESQDATVGKMQELVSLLAEILEAQR